MISKISVSCSIITICFRTLIFNKVKIKCKNTFTLKMRIYSHFKCN
jgi:propanediol utilization protein